MKNELKPSLFLPLWLTAFNAVLLVLYSATLISFIGRDTFSVYWLVSAFVVNYVDFFARSSPFNSRLFYLDDELKREFPGMAFKSMTIAAVPVIAGGIVWPYAIYNAFRNRSTSIKKATK